MFEALTVVVVLGIPKVSRDAVSPPSSPLPAYHKIDISAAAFCAPQPRSPIRQRQLGAVAGDLFGNVGLDLVPTRLAPNN
jgi:hypothetical protein